MIEIFSAAVRRAAVLFFVLFILGGCGIDEYIYLEPVSNIINNPTDSTDPAIKYFSFVTKDEDNATNAYGYFKGWEIYYRIYNSTTDRSTDTTAIAAKVDDDPVNAFYYVNTTKKYRRMTLVYNEDTSTLASAPLISGTASDRTVVLRPYSISDSYPAVFTAGGADVSIPTTSLNSLAWRSVSDVLAESFDYEEIDTTDVDVQYNSGSGTDSWFLQAYVFAYGFDTSFKVIYSEPVSLGSITIEP